MFKNFSPNFHFILPKLTVIFLAVFKIGFNMKFENVMKL